MANYVRVTICWEFGDNYQYRDWFEQYHKYRDDTEVDAIVFGMKEHIAELQGCGRVSNVAIHYFYDVKVESGVWK